MNMPNMLSVGNGKFVRTAGPVGQGLVFYQNSRKFGVVDGSARTLANAKVLRPLTSITSECLGVRWVE